MYVLYSPCIGQARSLMLETPSQILAQAHANAGPPQTPQREHREHRSREHRRVSRQALQDGNPLASPNQAHLKVSTRKAETPRSRDVSGQPIPPSSKRASQQQLSTADLRPRESSNGIPNVHPYAVAPSPSVLRASPYGNIPGVSPHRPESALAAGSTGALALPNGNGGANSDSFLYGSTAKRAEEAAAAAAREGRTNGMAVYDRGHVSRGVMDQDDEPRRRGFFSFMCCRG